jgi:APA family basic amino acid/polyamine antiporter
MALTVGAYAAPGLSRPIALAAVVTVTAIDLRGVQRTVSATRVIVAVVLVALALVVVAACFGGTASRAHFDGVTGGLRGILESAGLLFFAFAGYARIATLGEEVVEPQRTIPRAIPLALGIVLVVYAVVAVCALLAVGADGLATAAAPLHAVVEAGSLSALSPVVQVGAAVASLGALIALILGVSRTTLAMARDRELPAYLAAVHPVHAVPYRAELAVGAVVIVLVATLDLRGAIGFSSFGVLTYYALTNASALRMTSQERRPPRWVAVLGLVGCVVLAFTLPWASVVGGLGVATVGAAVWGVRHRGRRAG